MSKAFEEDLFQYLSNYEDLTSLVGTRIYPLTVSANTELPYVVYQKISSASHISHSGSSNLATSRYQFSCVAETYKEAKNIAEQLTTIFHGKTILFSDYNLYSGQKVNESDDYSEESDLYTVICDFIFWHNETYINGG